MYMLVGSDHIEGIARDRPGSAEADRDMLMIPPTGPCVYVHLSSLRTRNMYASPVALSPV